MIALGIDDVGACVKIDDTVPGILEGRRAGMWTVGIQAAQILAAALGLNARLATGLRHLTDVVDYPALATVAVQHRLRAFEHFDALDVVQVAVARAGSSTA